VVVARQKCEARATEIVRAPKLQWA
jgi:hypothetical protein